MKPDSRRSDENMQKLAQWLYKLILILIKSNLEPNPWHKYATVR
jgi:hypothetical protein